MKKTIFILIGIVLFLAQYQPGQASIELNTKSQQKNEHIKPEITQTNNESSSAKESLSANTNQKELTVSKKEISAIRTGNENFQKITTAERSPLSLAVPNLIDMNYYSPYIIAAAIAKNHRNIQSTRDTYAPLQYFYDSVGNLDYVTNTAGTKVGDVFYCDGSELYNCPIGWLDFIDLNPTGSPSNIDFIYYSNTPDRNYYATYGTAEPHIFVYNINGATGESVTSASDPLYDDATGTRVIYDFNMITGYQASVTTIDPNWLLWLHFSNQRLAYINNNDYSKIASFVSSPSSSIYRFWSDQKQGHFFTASVSEKDSIIANDKSWKYEGAAYTAIDSQASQSTPIYRFWSDSKQHHFYTASVVEKDSIIANDKSWRYEAIAYYAYASQMPNTTPVYRFWSDQKKGHFFTTSANEKDSIITNDHSWKYEGIAWYVPTN